MMLAMISGWAVALPAVLIMVMLLGYVERLQAQLRDAQSADPGPDCRGHRGRWAGCMDRDCRGRDA